MDRLNRRALGITGAAVALTFITAAFPVAAQTPPNPTAPAQAQSNQEKTVQEPAVPAPTTMQLPGAGGSSPLKKGEAISDTTLGEQRSPLEADAKAKPGSDNDFLDEGAITVLFDLSASQDALQRATDPRVHAYAQRQISSVGAISHRLEAFAAQRQHKLPLALDTKRQTALERLRKAESGKFDRAYAEQMASDWQELTQFYVRQDKLSKDAAIKAYIAAELPALKKNAVEAKDIYTSDVAK
jgi:putative membrane protein